jgi:hypothetical protein
MFSHLTLGKALFFRTLILFTSLFMASSISADMWHHEMVNFREAKRLLYGEEKDGELNKIRFGVFDISATGYKTILKDSMASEGHFPIQHNLYSTHGTKVASIIADQELGSTRMGKLSSLSFGIYFEDIKNSISLAEANKVKVVNISMTLRDENMIELVNESERKGLIYVVAAGNSAVHLGRELPAYYSNLNAIIVSCLDEDYNIPEFAQYDAHVTIMAPCGIGNIPARSLKYKVEYAAWPYLEPKNVPSSAVIIEKFGMTSSGTPQVTGNIINLLSIVPQLTYNHVKVLLKDSAREVLTDVGLVPLLDAEKLITFGLKIKEQLNIYSLDKIMSDKMYIK